MRRCRRPEHERGIGVTSIARRGEVARSGRHARVCVHGQGARERVPQTAPTWRGRRRSCRVSCRSPGATRQPSPEAAGRYGFERFVTDWHELVADPDVELFDNSGPNNLHADPTIAAAEAGKHVFCEKPLGRTADESYEIWQRVAGRRRQAHDRVQLPIRARRSARAPDDRGGRARRDPPLPRAVSPGVGHDDRRRVALPPDAAGSGALGDLGAHVIDLARYLVGEITAVSPRLRTFIPGREVDDAFEAVGEFEGGAVGRSRQHGFAPGRKNALSWEINGSKGSLALRPRAAERAASTPRARAAFARSSSPRPTTRSGTGGGRKAT